MSIGLVFNINYSTTYVDLEKMSIDFKFNIDLVLIDYCPFRRPYLRATIP